MKKKKRLVKGKTIQPYAKHEYSWYVVGFFVALLLLFSYFDKKEFFKINPLLVFIPVILISIYIIMKSASFAIGAISHYAKQTGISNYVIGFVVVAIATSIPELSTAYFASSIGKGGYVLGDVIGANITDLTLVLGVMVLVAGKIKLKKGIVGRIFFKEIAIVLLPIILGIDGNFSNIDGIILILGFVLYLAILIRQQGKLGKLKKDVKLKYIWKDIIVFGGTIAAILLSTSILIQSLNVLSNILNIPSIVIGSIILAIATTIPELTVEVESALKGVTSIGLGDLFGSVIVNSCLVLGVAALINPINIIDKPILIFTKGFDVAGSFNYLSFIIGAIIFILSLFLVSKYVKSFVLTKKHGTILISISVIFFAVQIILAILKNMV